MILLSNWVSFYSPLSPWSGMGITTDQAVFMTIADGILHGKHAYVDYFDHKGLFLYFILAAGLVFGKSLIGCFLIEWMVILVSVVFMYQMVRFFARREFAIIATAFVFACDPSFFTVSNGEEYIFPLLCISMYLFLLQLKDKAELKYSFMIGACAVLAFFIKYNYVLIWAAFGLVLFFGSTGGEEKKKVFAGYFLGLAAAASIFVIYLIKTDSMSAFIDTYVLYSLHYAQYSSFPDKFGAMAELIKCPIFIYMAAFVAMVFVLTIKRTSDTRLMWIWILMSAVTVITTGAPGQKWIYYRQMTMLIYVVPVALISQFLFDSLKKKRWLGGVLCATALLTIFAAGFMPEHFVIREDARKVSTDRITELIADNCDENDTMISFSNDCSMYFYSGMTPASRIIYPSAAIVDEKLSDELIYDIKNKRPKIITLQKDWKMGLEESFIKEVKGLLKADYERAYKDEYRTVYIVL